MSIYTKKGDGGNTSLFGKDRRRISKASSIIKVIGAVDEVNSYLGIIVSIAKTPKLKSQLVNVQKDLFKTGSILAGADIKWESRRAKELEGEIDRIERLLPEQKKFFLPGGTVVAAHLIYTRALVRRVERELVGLMRQSKFKKYKAEIVYLNRLSDYLFVLARKENLENGVSETVWRAS